MWKLKPMYEVWRVDAELIEEGMVCIRNVPVCSNVPNSHWPGEKCMMCKRIMIANYFIGHVLQYVEKPERIVRLLGPGFFCDGCGKVSKILTRLLQDWEAIALDRQEWEETSKKEGVIKARQIHICKENEWEWSETIYCAQPSITTTPFLNHDMI